MKSSDAARGCLTPCTLESERLKLTFGAEACTERGLRCCAGGTALMQQEGAAGAQTEKAPTESGAEEQRRDISHSRTPYSGILHGENEDRRGRPRALMQPLPAALEV